MTTITPRLVRDSWTPTVIQFVATHLKDVGSQVDAYLLSRVREVVPQSHVGKLPVAHRVALLRTLVDSGDVSLKASFPHDFWQVFLALAHHYRLAGEKEAEGNALRELQVEIEKRGAVAVLDDVKLGAVRREQHRSFGNRRGRQRHDEAVSRSTVWQAQANEIWQRNPSLSKTDVAKRIEREHGSGKYGTIRRHIEHPSH